MSSKKPQGLSPVAALCLRVVRNWLGVVSRGKGGELRNGVPYTRLKATEVQQQLEAEQGVAVSSKTVQRALTELVESRHLSRRQLYKNRYNRTYWYAPGELEQQLQKHRPSVVAKQQKPAVKPSLRTPQPVPSEGTPLSSQYLDAQLTKSTLLESKPKTAEEQNRKEEVVIRAWSPKKPVQTPPAAPRRWHKAQQQLTAVVQRATGFRGFSSGAAFPRTAKPAEHLAECPKISGFLR